MQPTESNIPESNQQTPDRLSVAEKYALNHGIDARKEKLSGRIVRMVRKTLTSPDISNRIRRDAPGWFITNKYWQLEASQQCRKGESYKPERRYDPEEWRSFLITIKKSNNLNDHIDQLKDWIKHGHVTEVFDLIVGRIGWIPDMHNKKTWVPKMTLDEIIALNRVWVNLIKSDAVDKTRTPISNQVITLLRCCRASRKLIGNAGSIEHGKFLIGLGEVFRAIMRKPNYHSSILKPFYSGIEQGIQNLPRGTPDHNISYLVSLKYTENILETAGQVDVHIPLEPPIAIIEGINEKQISSMKTKGMEYVYNRTINVMMSCLNVSKRSASTLIQGMSWPECEFLMLVAQQSRNNPREFWNKVKERRYLFQAYKRTGAVLSHEERSQLWFEIEKNSNVAFQRDIPLLQYLYWLDAIDNNISVEPMIQSGTADDDAFVKTRFCGPSLRQLMYMAEHLKQNGYQNCIQLDQLLYKILYSAVGNIRELSAIIDHGHPHSGNITVEFVANGHYEKYKNKINDPSFYKFSRVNQEGYQPYRVHYDMFEYLAHPEHYTIVTRVIDFDQASEVRLPYS